LVGSVWRVSQTEPAASGVLGRGWEEIDEKNCWLDSVH